MRLFGKLALLCALVAALALAAAQYQRWRARTTAPAPSTETPPIPVDVETARAQDVPIILRGLGRVAAFNTVEIRSRVTGNIVRIAFREGQEVRTGDLLVQLDPRPFQAALDQATATLARDQANLANARSDLSRYAGLVGKNYISQQQYSTQAASVHADEAVVELDRASIDAAKLNVEYAAIVSPIDGVTGIRQADIGTLVQANSQALLIVTQIKPIYVVFPLPEESLPRVREAMETAHLQVAAFDSADARQIAVGELKLIDNQVDATTGTVRLKAEFLNRNEALWPGQFVNAHLVLETVKQGVTIGAAAVQTGPQGSFVFVARADDTVELRPVTVRQTENNLSLIGSGLGAGERVVTVGQSRLTEGAKISVARQPAPPPQRLGAAAE